MDGTELFRPMPPLFHPIQPAKVRYIKLGEGGSWESNCVKNGIIRFGFGTGRSDRFDLCRQQRWNELASSFLAEDKTQGTATRFRNETQAFFEDDGSTLWITFVGEWLYWGMLTDTLPERYLEGNSVFRTVTDGWRRTDLNGEPLTKDRLSGALTKLAAYRGTSCGVDVADYVILRINGQKSPEVERAVATVEAMKQAALDLMRLLGPGDFETLVDLVFSTSGWRRLGAVGKTQKTLDLDLILPSTGERAFVQVKAQTTSDELAEYVSKIEEHGPYDRMFYAFHSGKAVTEDDRVTVLGPEKLAEMVVEAGLVGWLIRKVS
jgi:hypothetical protein